MIILNYRFNEYITKNIKTVVDNEYKYLLSDEGIIDKNSMSLYKN